MTKQYNWFWAHRRNTSLHHMSFFGAGLRGRGFLPVCDFHFDHQIYYGVPNKGCYIFYDKNQLSQRSHYKNIQKSIDKNKHFVKDFRNLSDELFGKLFKKCDSIDKVDMELLTDKEILQMYDDFIKAVTVGPILTVQLWGIEALIQPEYRIIKLLNKRLNQWGEEHLFQSHKEILLTNTGETVAFSEQKDFYQMLVKVQKNIKLNNIIKNQTLYRIQKLLDNFPKEDNLITKHIEKYLWMNSEYVSGTWDKRNWIKLIKQAIKFKITPKQQLNKIQTDFSSSLKQRNNFIKRLNPTKSELLAIDALSEFIAQRDWSKGHFTKALLSYRKLLTTIANSLGESEKRILNYHHEELRKSLFTIKKIPKTIIDKRIKYGYVILNKTGSRKVIEGSKKIRNILRKEKVVDPSKKIIKKFKSIRGLIANKGKITGRANVLESAKGIDKFKKGEILVTYMTTMEFTPVFRKAGAVITDEGGMSSHAAIVSREFDIPCIVGTKIATRIIKTGDQIEVDANQGIIKIIK